MYSLAYSAEFKPFCETGNTLDRWIEYMQCYAPESMPFFLFLMKQYFLKTLLAIFQTLLQSSEEPGN